MKKESLKKMIKSKTLFQNVTCTVSKCYTKVFQNVTQLKTRKLIITKKDNLTRQKSRFLTNKIVKKWNY